MAQAEATSAKASRLAAQASLRSGITAVDKDAQLGPPPRRGGRAALTRKCHRLHPSAGARAVHLRAVPPERGVTGASFSPDGTRIAVGTNDGIVRIYAGDARTRLKTLRLGRRATGASFSPDGRRVLTTEQAGPARIWDAVTGAQLGSLGAAPTAASFSNDGALVVTVDTGRRTRLGAPPMGRPLPRSADRTRSAGRRSHRAPTAS